ncbi:DUF440 family protein [Gallaecimonas sp. GXIMD1310]|uniref:DUF440 family protein n=1 Tax=Gallaecimonas sp. GXIMD1310 TaxID=3131926 RepID=UPI00324F80D4
MTVDDAIEFGYEHFLKLAADHLCATDLVDLTLEFEQRGAVDAVPASADWAMTSAVDPTLITELHIGLVGDNDEFEVIFCRMLLALDGRFPPQCIWKR